MPSDPVPAPPTVRLGRGPELAAALPQLLGFAPQESLVLVVLTGPEGTRVGVTVRVDLPAPHEVAAVVGPALRAVGPVRPAAVVALVVTEQPDDVVVGALPEGLLDVPVGDLDPGALRALRLGADDGAEVRDLPGRGVLRELARTLDGAGVPLVDAWLVRGGRCWSYDCAQPCCDPGAGHPLPAGTTELAAAAVLTGQVVAADRAEIVARLAAPTGVALVAMGRACTRVGAEQAAALGREGWERTGERGWRSVLTAVDRYRPGAVRGLTDDEAAAVAWAVADHQVRDRALGLGVGPRAAAAEALWTDLVRRLPVPLDTSPATLLAATAWARGDGTTAAIALDRALAGQPSHHLARLLRRGLTQGLPPAEVRAWLTAAGEGGWPAGSEQLGA